MEELLRELLAGQKQLFEGQKELVEGQKELFAGQKELVEGQKQLFEGQKGILERLDNLEGQVSENTNFIKALLHRTDELDAKFDGLLHTTLTKDAISHLATKEDIAALDFKIEALNVRLSHQEEELCRLTIVK